MGRNKKDEILNNGLNLTQVKTDYFSFQYGYHYYEPKVYDLNCYFEGFNLRQLKRVMYIYNQFALSFESYIHLMANKKRRGEVITKDEETAHISYAKVYNQVLDVTDFMRKFKNTSKVRYSNQRDEFGEQYDKVMHNRCWVRPIEELANQKHVKFKTEHGQKWRVGPTVEYFPEDSLHIHGISNITVFYDWGYWLEYVRVACMENFFETEELNEFDFVGLMTDMFNDSLILLDDLKKLEYFKMK